MIDVERNSRFLAALAIAIAVIAATYIGASRWEHVRNKPKERSLKVTGSAKKRILSDLAEWSATIALDTPGPRDTMATPARPVSSPSAWAMKPAPDSCLQTIT